MAIAMLANGRKSVLGLVRILIVLFGWLFLMPKPGTSVDFFRATAIYTLCMTYDYVSFFQNAKKEGKVVTSGYYALMVLYSFIFLVLNLVGMVHFADLLYADASVIQFFPETPMQFQIGRLSFVFCMIGYPALCVLERIASWIRIFVSDYYKNKQKGVTG